MLQVSLCLEPCTSQPQQPIYLGGMHTSVQTLLTNNNHLMAEIQRIQAVLHGSEKYCSMF